MNRRDLRDCGGRLDVAAVGLAVPNLGFSDNSPYPVRANAPRGRENTLDRRVAPHTVRIVDELSPSLDRQCRLRWGPPPISPRGRAS